MVTINVTFVNSQSGESISETVTFNNHDERHKYCSEKCKELNESTYSQEEWYVKWDPVSGLANDLF